MQSITESSKVPEGVMMNWASLAKKLKPNTGGYHSGSKLRISFGNSLEKIYVLIGWKDSIGGGFNVCQQNHLPLISWWWPFEFWHGVEKVGWIQKPAF